MKIVNTVKCILIFSILILLSTLHVNGQLSNRPKTLDNLVIGSQVPDISIRNIINYKDTASSIYAFKGKLLILDFWATWCGPCIAALPKLDSLQKKFGDQIQIIGVTRETKQIVDEFTKKLKKVKDLLPPSATNDFSLNNYFKHNVLPHYVWIDQDHRLVAVTDGTVVNENNIAALLNGNTFTFRFKQDELKDVIQERGQALIVPTVRIESGDSIKLVPATPTVGTKHSYVSRYMDGVVPGSIYGTRGVLTVKNTTVWDIYKSVIWAGKLEVLNATPSTLVVDIPNDSLYELVTGMRRGWKRLVQAGYEAAEWIKKYGFCYELSFPDFLESQKNDIAVSDLNQYFGALYNIECVKQRRLAKYLALVRTTQEDKMATKGGPTIEHVDKLSLRLQNEDINSLFFMLANPFQAFPPMVDETGYLGNIDIEINCPLSNLEAVNRELAKYGLRFQEKEKMSDVAVIRMKQ